jgi:hypothetical protein
VEATTTLTQGEITKVADATIQSWMNQRVVVGAVISALVEVPLP